MISARRSADGLSLGSSHKVGIHLRAFIVNASKISSSKEKNRGASGGATALCRSQWTVIFSWFSEIPNDILVSFARSNRRNYGAFVFAASAVFCGPVSGSTEFNSYTRSPLSGAPLTMSAIVNGWRWTPLTRSSADSTAPVLLFSFASLLGPGLFWLSMRTNLPSRLTRVMAPTSFGSTYRFRAASAVRDRSPRFLADTQPACAKTIASANAMGKPPPFIFCRHKDGHVTRCW